MRDEDKKQPASFPLVSFTQMSDVPQSDGVCSTLHKTCFYTFVHQSTYCKLMLKRETKFIQVNKDGCSCLQLLLKDPDLVSVAFLKLLNSSDGDRLSLHPHCGEQEMIEISISGELSL